MEQTKAPTATKEAAKPAAPTDLRGLGPKVGAVQFTEKSALYWVGIIPWNKSDPASKPPPFHHCTVGPVSFQTWFTPWEGAGEGGEGVRGRYPGKIERYTASQMARFVSELQRTAVRWREHKGDVHDNGFPVRAESAEEIEAQRKRFALREDQVAMAMAKIEIFMYGDEPLSKFIYCVRTTLPEGSHSRPGQIPASVYDLGIELPN